MGFSTNFGGAAALKGDFDTLVMLVTLLITNRRIFNIYTLLRAQPFPTFQH